MSVLFANNATAVLASGITSGATSIALNSGQGALFPSPSGANYFYATLTNVSNQIEIVKCTARTGDTLTVVRGQEGTTARAYLTGDSCQLRLTAQGLADIQAIPAGAVGTTQLANLSVTTAILADASVTSAKLADLSVIGTKFADNSVITAKLNDGAVTTPKIADAAVTGAKLAAGVVPAALGFTPARGDPAHEVRFVWDGSHIQVAIDTVAVGYINPVFDTTAAVGGGYRGYYPYPIVPDTTLALGHAGGLMVAATNGQNITIPPVSSVLWTAGTRIKIYNDAGADINILRGAGVVLRNTANNVNSDHAMHSGGMAELVCIRADLWTITGDGVV